MLHLDKRYTDPHDLDPPEFDFGEVCWFCDDEREDSPWLVQVMGIEYSPYRFTPDGWWYSIRFLKGIPDRWMPEDTRESVHQTELMKERCQAVVVEESLEDMQNFTSRLKQVNQPPSSSQQTPRSRKGRKTAHEPR